MHAKNGGKKGCSDLKSKKSSTAKEVTHLPFAQKIMTLRGLTPRERLDRIVTDPEARKLVNTLDPQEVYWLIKDIGESDALELLELCHPEQALFFLDMECWEKNEFSIAKFLEWLGYLLECGEQKVAELLPYLDSEFLTLCLIKTISVGGGIGDLVTREEIELEWDHTFDDCYFISFRNSGHSAMIGRFIDIIYRNDHPLYLALMESLRSEIPSETEQLSYQFRTGRLADLGFPAYEDAISIYSFLDPDTYTRTEEKKLFPGSEQRVLNLPLNIFGDSLLRRALRVTEAEELLLELNGLINNAIIAEGAPLSDGMALQAVFERVHGYLNIALEYLCGENEEKAGEILEQEYLKRLFQLGRSIIIPLRQAAEKLFADGGDFSYATNKALLGLKSKHPKFYRGLDPDTADGYREFRNMDDVRKMEAFMHNLVTHQDG